MTPTDIPVMCYDLHAISRFFRSCALAMAVQQTTKMQWETYRDSSVLNAVYTVMFWKEPPGQVEVKTGTKTEIDRKTDQYHEEFLLIWLRKLFVEGPIAAHEYVRRMERVRGFARDAVQDIFIDAGSINDEVIGQTSEAISRLAKIKLASQVGVAVIGAVTGVGFVAAAAGGTAAGAGAAGAGLTILGLEAGAGATAFAVAGTAHSVTHSVIKNWEGGNRAQIAGISTEIGKSTASEVGGNIAGKSLENALKGTLKSQNIIKSAEGEIRKQTQRLAQEGLKKRAKRKATNIVAQRTAQVTAQKGAIEQFGKQATNAARVGKAIPVVFAALDIWDAFGDYRDTMASLK